jgi:hypothetical protein
LSAARGAREAGASQPPGSVSIRVRQQDGVPEWASREGCLFLAKPFTHALRIKIAEVLPTLLIALLFSDDGGDFTVTSSG